MFQILWDNAPFREQEKPQLFLYNVFPLLAERGEQPSLSVIQFVRYSWLLFFTLNCRLQNWTVYFNLNVLLFCSLNSIIICWTVYFNLKLFVGSHIVRDSVPSETFNWNCLQELQALELNHFMRTAAAAFMAGMMTGLRWEYILFEYKECIFFFFSFVC
jgi:hypothetical protein